MKKKINFALNSWKGKRPVNQDALACSYNKNKDLCAVVCDGVGSVNGSENASRIVANVFTNAFEKTTIIEKPSVWFRETLGLALNELNKYIQEHHAGAIATTIACLLIIGDKFYSFNIGDTRVYAFIKHKTTHEVKQYSFDHNYYNYLLLEEASQETIQANQSKWHALTNYIDATNPSVARFDTNSGLITQHTYFLVCTDGLYSYVRDNQKYEIITRVNPLSLRIATLLKTAYANGSDDNISGIIVSVK